MTGRPLTLRAIGSRVVALHCELIGIAHGRIHLQTDCRFEPQTRTMLTFNRVMLEAIVQDCDPRPEGFSISLRATAEAGRRRERRLPVNQPATIRFHEHGNIALDGTLTDFSRSGLKMRAAQAIPDGTAVIVETAVVIAVGETRHCEEIAGFYEIGVETTDVLTGRNEATARVSAIENLRWKLATMIVGEKLANARKFIQ